MRNVEFQLELKDHMKQFTIKNTSSDRVSIHSKLNSVNLGNLPFLYPPLNFDLKGQFTRIGKIRWHMQDFVGSFIKNINRRLCCQHFAFLTQPPISDIGAGEKQYRKLTGL